MKIKYHRPHNNRKRFSQLILLTVVVLAVIAGLSVTGQLKYISTNLYATALLGASVASTMVGDVHNILTPKSTLLKENQKLRTKINNLKVIALHNQSLSIENQRLRALLNPAIGASYKQEIDNNITARIIDYKSITYGTILAKVELAEGELVDIGALAHFGNLAIGKVESVDNAYILIKLFTSSDQSHSVLVGDMVSTFNGTSNDSGEIVISRTEDVELGTVVSLPYAGGLIIGSVEEIERAAEDSMQTLLIRAPISIRQLHFISITND